MSKSRKSNPNWGKPSLENPGQITLTAFEKVVQKMNLAPHQYSTSASLRAWVAAHRKKCYVPESLLILWGFNSPS